MPISPVLSTGARLDYAVQGDASGVPVIMLHGLSDSRRSYEPALPYLPASVRAFAISARGHGDSDRPAGGYRAEDSVADVAAFMDAVGIESAVVVGHSWGSYIAQRFAAHHPERTLGLVLLGAFASIADKPDLQEFTDVLDQFTDPVDPVFIREFQESTLAQPIPPAFLDTVVIESSKVPARVWQAVMGGLIEAEVPSTLATITAPMLIVWGDQDVYCPRSDQEAILGRIPGARLVTYEGAGHAFHWEEPERTAADIAAFAAGLAPASKAA